MDIPTTENESTKPLAAPVEGESGSSISTSKGASVDSGTSAGTDIGASAETDISASVCTVIDSGIGAVAGEGKKESSLAADAVTNETANVSAMLGTVVETVIASTSVNTFPEPNMASKSVEASPSAEATPSILHAENSNDALVVAAPIVLSTISSAPTTVTSVTPENNTPSAAVTAAATSASSSAAASTASSSSASTIATPTQTITPSSPAVSATPTPTSTPSISNAAPEEVYKEPLLSDYLNYRDFLRAFYLYKREITKSHHRRYNYSFFSAAADIRSPNYLRLIIEGQRNLSEEMAFKFARAMQLNKEGTDEFVLMVLYGQETDPMLRNQYLKTLSDFRLQKSLKLGVIDKKIMEKVPNWIGWILFALLDQEGARFTSSSLKSLLRNKASETEIQSALNKLLESGELVQDAATGEIKKGRPQVEAGDDIPSDLIRRLQTQLMSLGLESLFQDSPLDREFGTLTLSLTKKEFEELRFQLRKFRKQIHKDNSIQRMQAKGERVYQLNLQLYPVTDRSQTIAELENN